MNNEMEEAKQAFKLECEELLQEMEDGLLQLEDNLSDTDPINAIFRAAHTIKGSSGVFGLDDIVTFTHIAESLLDKMRDGEIAVTADAVALLLQASDHMVILVNHVIENDQIIDEALASSGEQLMAQLNAFMGGGSVTPKTIATVVTESPVSVESSAAVATDNWHISLRFGRDVLRNGMDPLSFIRYLATQGEIVALTTLFEDFPAATEMDPEQCYLGFEIDFNSSADKTTIEQVFEFVRDDCDIRIIAPQSHLSNYIDLIHALPEDDMKIGEILVKGGALTEHELTQALQGQQVSAEKLGEILVKDASVSPQVVAAAVDKQAATQQQKAKESRTIRIDAEKLDNLITLVGELVIASSRSFLLAQKNGDDDLVESISTTTRLVEEIRDSALTARMVPIGETFNRFKRVVRDVSKELGKDIKLTIEGGDTELDKTVVEKIGDPLMHLMRNSMDHGIEDNATRLANGKTAQGNVFLNAYHDSGSIVIEIVDDGGGLNRDKIAAKAVERGLIPEEHKLSEQDIDRLVFEPGFSTAETVTNLSGRGVGMDVVRKNIEALRGTVDVLNEPGIGATFTIRLPLTLAIIDGFLVGVGESAYVVPLDMVVECVELEQDEQQGIQNNNYINLRGEVLPFVRLGPMFGEVQKENVRENIVVVQYAGQKAGLVVDELLGEFQTVIKPLSKVFQMLKGVSGATILGNGKVAVILDVPALIAQAESFDSHLLSSQIQPTLQQVVH